MADDQNTPEDEPLTDAELDAVAGGMGDAISGGFGEAGLGEAGVGEAG